MPFKNLKGDATNKTFSSEDNVSRYMTLIWLYFVTKVVTNFMLAIFHPKTE